MMNEWFECKVRYEKTLENGLVKKVTEPYLVDALSFTEAERRFIEEIEPFMSGEFQVTDIKRAKYAELFETDEDAADRWFKAKVAFITLDEKSGAEKKSNQNMLIQASDLRDAVKRLDKRNRLYCRNAYYGRVPLQSRSGRETGIPRSIIPFH